MTNFTSKIYRGFGKLITEFLEDSKERIKVIDHIITTLIFSYLSIQKEVLFKFTVAFPHLIQSFNEMVITEVINWIYWHFIKDLVKFVWFVKNEFSIPLKQTINFLFAVVFAISIRFYNKLVYLENVILTFSRKLYDSIKFTHAIKNEFLIPLRYAVNFFGRFTFAITSVFYNALQVVENVLLSIKSSLVSSIQLISYVRSELSALVYDLVIFQFIVTIIQKITKYFYNQLQLAEYIASRLSTSLISTVSINSIVKLVEFLTSIIDKVSFYFVVSIIQKISKYFYNQMQLLESVVSRLSTEFISSVFLSSIVKLTDYFTSLINKVLFDFVVSIILKISKYFYNQLQLIESVVSRLSTDITSNISISSIVRLLTYITSITEGVIFTFYLSIIQKISKYFYNAINTVENVVRNISGSIASLISIASIVKLELYLTSILERMTYTFYVQIITKSSKYFYNLLSYTETILRTLSGNVISIITISSVVKLMEYLSSVLERIVVTFAIQIITKFSKYFYNLMNYTETVIRVITGTITSAINLASVVKLLDYIGNIIDKVVLGFMVSIITKFSKYFYNLLNLVESVIRIESGSIMSAISNISIIRLISYIGSIIERTVFKFTVSIITKFSAYFYNLITSIETIVRRLSGDILSSIAISSIVKLLSYTGMLLENVIYTFVVSIVTKFSKYFYNTINGIETILRNLSGSISSAVSVISIIRLLSYATNIFDRILFTFIVNFVTKFSKYFYNLMNAIETILRGLSGSNISLVSIISLVQYTLSGIHNVYDRILITFGLRVREPTFFDKWKFDQPTFDEVEYDV